MHLGLERCERDFLSVDTDEAISLALGYDPIRRDFDVIDMGHVEEGAVLDGEHGLDGKGAAAIAVDGDDVLAAVVGEGGGEEVGGFGHVGHVAAIEVTQFVAGNDGPVWWDRGIDGAVDEGGETVAGVWVMAGGGGGFVVEFFEVAVSDLGFGGNFEFDCEIAGINCFAEDADEEAVGEARATHPTHVVCSKVGFGDDADRLGEEGQRSSVALRN